LILSDLSQRLFQAFGNKTNPPSLIEQNILIVGSPCPVTVSTKKAPEKPREKVKKWRFFFQKCWLQTAICFGAALFSALHEVT